MSRRLGRGLDALIPSLNIQEDDKILEIPIDSIRPNPYQPRKQFDDETIEELSQSIKEHGIIQPIIVRSVLKGYELIAGERRWRASKHAGMEQISAVVKDLNDQQVMEIALIENLQREDLNAMEIAVAYQNLIEQFDLTQEELAVKVGKSRSHIANFLRLLQLPEAIKENVSRGTLSMGHARALAGLDSKPRQIQLSKKVMEQQWSVRELEIAIQKESEQNKINRRKKVTHTDPYMRKVEDDLREHLKTTVKIKPKKNRGTIEISYFSKEDLERLLQLFQQQT